MLCPTLKDLPPPPPGKTGWPWTDETDGRRTTDDGRAWPKISIVTPSYNQGQFIEEAIRSVLLQGYPNLEYIIIDGGSDDDSVEIIKRYQKWLTYWVSENDRSQSDAINKGYSKATGEIFAWLNSDDIYCPGTLQRVGRYWASHPDCNFLCGDGEFVDSAGKKREYYIKADEYSFRDLLNYHRGKYLPQPSVFFSNRIFWEAGGVDTDLEYTMDLDLWLRIIQRHPLHYLPFCLSKLRHHQDAKTWRHNELAMGEVKDILTKRLNAVNLLERLNIRTGFKFFYASSLCQKALSEYFEKDSCEAFRLLKKAVKICPGILLSSASLKVALRIIFPESFKRCFFNNP